MTRKGAKHAGDCPRGDPWIGFIDDCMCGESARRGARKADSKVSKADPKVSKADSKVSKTAVTVSVNADEVLVSALIEAVREDALWQGGSFASDGDPSIRLGELRSTVLDRLSAEAKDAAWKRGVFAAIEAIRSVEAVANKRYQDTSGIDNIETYAYGVLAGVRDAERALKGLLFSVKVGRDSADKGSE